MRIKITLEDISNQEKIRLKLNSSFLLNLLRQASKDEKPHCNKEFVNKLGMSFTTKYLNTTIISWIKNSSPIKITIIKKLKQLANVSWEEIQNNVEFIDSGENGTKISNIFPISITSDLGTIVGHILGDGSIDKKYLQVFFSNSNKDLLVEFQDKMNKIFGLGPRIWMQNKPEFNNTSWDKRLNSIDEMQDGRNIGLYYPSICGIVLNTIFENFVIGKNKIITPTIEKANKEFKRFLIRAFFDDESNVGEKSIRVFQDKKDILEFLRKVLKEEFNILAGEIKSYFKKNKIHFYFDIHKKSNIKIFAEQVGLTSSQKMKSLEKIISKKPHFNDK
jgi:hypothetical protein